MSAFWKGSEGGQNQPLRRPRGGDQRWFRQEAMPRRVALPCLRPLCQSGLASRHAQSLSVVVSCAVPHGWIHSAFPSEGHSRLSPQANPVSIQF